MKDGWHVICGCEVYVEDGKIIRGVLQKSPLNRVAAWVYRSVGHGWSREDSISVAAFRAGFKRGTIRLL